MSKLIMIDDDMMHHKIAQLMLREYGNIEEVILSTDAKETLDFLELNKANSNNLPDYIFLDLQMPDYSGWDFLKGYQKIHHSLRKDIKLYIVSSSIDPKDIKRSEEYKFVDSFVQKPLTREFLHNLVA